MSHRRLDEQLRALELDAGTPPDADGWRQVLAAVSESYREADQQRQQLDRSLERSSHEIQALGVRLRSAAQKRVAAERDKLRAVIRTLGAGVCLLDGDGQVLSINPEAGRLLGYRDVELIGRPFLERLERRPAHAREASAADDTQTGLPIERVRDTRFLCADGTLLPVAYTLTARPDPDRAAFSAVLVFVDISEHHRLANALRASTERYRRLVDAAPTVILTIDDDAGTIRSLNPAFATLTGWPRRRWQGRSLIPLVHPDDADRARSRIAEVLAGQTTAPFELRVMTQEGGYLVGELVGTPLVEEDGSNSMLGVMRDVTERRRAERAMREAKEAAETASLAKSDFLANMSHEIRTPLNAIIGMTSLLLDTALDSQQQCYTETIRSSGGALLALINDILDFSKIESGKMELEEQPFEVSDCLRGALELVAADAAGKGLELNLVMADHCPPFLIGDVTRVRQVLANLLSNAVKFTDRGEVRVTVGGKLSSADRFELAVSIRDTGIGIPPAKLDRVFRSFSQVDASTSRKYGGSGLGLAISRHLCELMGGRISFTSVEGEGSDFRVVIPARTADAPADEDGWDGDQTIDSELAGHLPLHILVAEDNVVNQQVALMLLRRMGYRAELAANGNEVLEALARQRYDVVLMDVMMPDLDGLATSRRICRRWPRGVRPRIIAMTASAMPGDREKCLAAGMDDYIAKPVVATELQAALRRNAARIGKKDDRGASTMEPESAPAAPDPEADQTSVDFTTLDELRTFRPAMVEDLVGKFVSHTETELTAMRHAMAAGDIETVERTAHSLKGSSGTIGAMQLAELCARMERHGRARDLEAARAMATAVDVEAAQVAAVLEQRLASWASERTPGDG